LSKARVLCAYTKYGVKTVETNIQKNIQNTLTQKIKKTGETHTETALQQLSK